MLSQKTKRPLRILAQYLVNRKTVMEADILSCTTYNARLPGKNVGEDLRPKFVDIPVAFLERGKI